MDSTLVKATARAFRWEKMLVTARYVTMGEIATAERINPSYVSPVLRCHGLMTHTLNRCRQLLCIRLPA